ncbi:MAG TPA: hypothetical protein VHK64_05975 [Nocardioidaceae bacterium]|jgi:hypothetical protein|nr:hypothetical protein [Nocardioidaceae bacterium]
MTDFDTREEPSGSCVTCARRDPHRGLVCNADRSKLRSWLREIPDLFDDLVAQDEPDPLAAGPVKGQSAGGPVSGSKERKLPIDEDAIDLSGPVRGVRLLGEDQIGYSSVASELDFWVEDWREARGRGEGRPDPTVRALATWLEVRAEDACDAHPAVDEMFEAVRKLRSALRGVLKLIEPLPEYRPDVPCPGCSRLTLYKANGSDRYECDSCPRLLTPEEFDRWAGLVLADKKWRKRHGMPLVDEVPGDD